MGNVKIDIKNNLEKGIFNVDHHKELLDKLIKIDTEKEVRRNCQEIASAVSYKLYIFNEGKNLISVLGSPKLVNNNLDAISEWIYKRNPNLSEVKMEIISKYKNELQDFLNEYRSND